MANFKKKQRIKIIANSMIDPGMSGGNRIFIEFVKVWRDLGADISIDTSANGRMICQKSKLEADNWRIWPAVMPRKFGMFFAYLMATFYGVWQALLDKNKYDFVWSTSDFYPDSLPGLIYRLKGFCWGSSIFLFPPPPKKSGFSVNAVIHYYSQKPVFWLSKKLANYIFVTNEGDADYVRQSCFPKSKVLALRGGVHFKYLNTFPKQPIKYLACFMGRLHRHKAVVELVDIWRLVASQIPQAKLAVIGDGPDRVMCEEKVRRLNLENNIKFFGFIDGEEKYKIIKQSRIFLHSSLVDSGGMSACEAMAMRLPVVGYNLAAFRTYYPRGMLKAKPGNQKEFAKLVLMLYYNQKLYAQTSRAAHDWAEGWDWAANASQIYNIFDLCYQKDSTLS